MDAVVARGRKQRTFFFVPIRLTTLVPFTQMEVRVIYLLPLQQRYHESVIVNVVNAPIPMSFAHC